MKLSRKQILGLIASLPEETEAQRSRKRRLIAMEITQGNLSEADVAEIVAADLERNFDRFAREFGGDEFLNMLWHRFANYPRYLARALVQVRPDLFYAYGFAFRLILKLKANLGTVLTRPVKHGIRHDPSRFVAELPDQVAQNLLSLDRERTFREYLYLFSRDVDIGFEMISDAIDDSHGDYDQALLGDVRDYYDELLQRSYPEFVRDIEGSLFPSVHVRWWEDLARSQNRVLNIGDTSTHKTAFAVSRVLADDSQRCLVVCPAHARLNWPREIGLYLQDKVGRSAVVRNSGASLREALRSDATFTVIGTTAFSEPGVAARLAEAGFCATILDEAHYMNRASGASASQRARAWVDYLQRNTTLRRLTMLTATPWQNHPFEFATIAFSLRPDIFETPDSFVRARAIDPRFVREFFAEQILDVERREVMDLQPVTPNPWEDPFGAHHLRMLEAHSRLYHFVRETEQVPVHDLQKVPRLLHAANHPFKLQDVFRWPRDIRRGLAKWELSTKLVWLKERLEQELSSGAKVAVATGIFVEGITRPQEKGDPDEIWVGKLLSEWFGEDAVLILDGDVSQSIDRDGTSPRDQLIARWKTDPEARILLFSMRACPDSLNLSVPALPNVTKLVVVAFLQHWLPWIQVLGRFLRRQLGVPMEYLSLVIDGTVDESLLELCRKKWTVYQLFRALVPLTEEEIALFRGKLDVGKIAEQARSSIEHVNIIGAMVRGQGEEGSVAILSESCGLSTNAEVFARAFYELHEHSTSGHISRFMAPVIRELEKEGLVHAEGILDAGCGPLTLERRLEQPVFGVDLNPYMIQLGQQFSSLEGRNARVERISQIPSDWDGRFELTVASLVLDWLILDPKHPEQSDRLAVLDRLVRVTHPHGRVWITATASSLDEELLRRWTGTFEQMGFLVIRELTGLVRATDATPTSPFSFWSLCFSPNGQQFVCDKPGDFRFLFETEQVKTRRGRTNDEKEQILQRPTEYRHFELTGLSGRTVEGRQVARSTSSSEVGRMIQTPNLHGWRFHRLPSMSAWRWMDQAKRRGVDIEAELRKRGLF